MRIIMIETRGRITSSSIVVILFNDAVVIHDTISDTSA